MKLKSLTSETDAKFNDIIEEDGLILYEMANLHSNTTGIDNIVIWVGKDYDKHAMRIKVSNVPNKWASDNFTITLPKLDVVGKINKSLISGKTLSNITSWIKLNIDTLMKYETGEIDDTREFLDKLVKI